MTTDWIWHDWFHDILHIAGPLFFLCMQGSAIQTAYKIYHSKSVGSLSSATFLTLFVNCNVWTIYGALKGDGTLLLPNLSGMIIGYLCSVIYHIFSEVGIPFQYIIITIILTIIAIILGLLHNFQILGLLGVSMAVILMGSPLITMTTVIKDQSTESMPFSISLMAWFNSLSWSLYGIIVSQDPMVYIPNLLGFILSTIQLCLFVIYGFPSEIKSNYERHVIINPHSKLLDKSLRQNSYTYVRGEDA